MIRVLALYSQCTCPVARVKQEFKSTFDSEVVINMPLDIAGPGSRCQIRRDNLSELYGAR